ncbi:ATP-binding protein [Streptomyces sp. NBC_01808]|uniref:sensor histidine kinase n=1 Tax=Streptomyces sp. NBC_01808 TaxID=2975947 RepID=UPI002DDC4045|nr:ATP-binding protein [Streptomyces sp. NBC_01808]WSA39184.1 ATP-binding protein [Streptomyces sp. NBC_01808]
MSDHPAPAGNDGPRQGRFPSRRRRAGRALRARLWRVTLLPVTAALLVGGATTYGALIGGSTSAETRMIIGAGVLAVVGITVLAILRIGALADALDAEEDARAERNLELTALLEAAQGELLRLVDQAQRGERPEPDALSLSSPSPAGYAPAGGGTPTARAAADVSPETVERLVHATVHAALKAVVDVSSRGRIEVFVNLARRLQNLVIRSLDELDALEKQVEDPDLLHGLFQLDHLVTRLRRQVESLAILGGAVPRRISRPMPVNAVLRSAVSEVEDYGRVKLVPPMTGVLEGAVAPDVIHLIAELVENAAGFSPPETKVELRVEPAAAGLVVEIDDRGLGLQSDTQDRMNTLLSRATPQVVDEQIKDGRIGLLVVAHLARRHRIPVQLQRNVYGGCRATVLLPNALLMDPEEKSKPAAAAAAPQPQPAAAAAPQPAALAADAAERRPATVGSAAPASLPSRSANGVARQRQPGAAEINGATPSTAAHEATGGHRIPGVPETTGSHQITRAQEITGSHDILGAYDSTPAYDGTEYESTTPYENTAAHERTPAHPPPPATPSLAGEPPLPAAGHPDATPHTAGPAAGYTPRHAAPPPASPAPAPGQRPPLPERSGSHLVPELRREPGIPGAAPGGAAAPSSPLNTGLMASFTAGSRAAEDGDQRAAGYAEEPAGPTPQHQHQHRSTEGPSS